MTSLSTFEPVSPTPAPVSEDVALPPSVTFARIDRAGNLLDAVSVPPTVPPTAVTACAALIPSSSAIASAFVPGASASTHAIHIDGDVVAVVHPAPGAPADFVLLLAGPTAQLQASRLVATVPQLFKIAHNLRPRNSDADDEAVGGENGAFNGTGFRDAAADANDVEEAQNQQLQRQQQNSTRRADSEGENRGRYTSASAPGGDDANVVVLEFCRSLVARLPGGMPWTSAAVRTAPLVDALCGVPLRASPLAPSTSVPDAAAAVAAALQGHFGELATVRGVSLGLQSPGGAFVAPRRADVATTTALVWHARHFMLPAAQQRRNGYSTVDVVEAPTLRAAAVLRGWTVALQAHLCGGAVEGQGAVEGAARVPLRLVSTLSTGVSDALDRLVKSCIDLRIE